MAFRKSTRCGSSACVEVDTALDLDAREVFFRVRDSKNPDGPVLTFDLNEWRSFVSGMKAGEFDVPDGL